MSVTQSKQHSFEKLQFIAVYAEHPLFDVVKHYFHHLISKLYGDQERALDLIKKGEDRTCLILQKTGTKENLGLIVFKNHLQTEYTSLGFSRTLEIKTLFVMNPIRNQNKKIATRMLHYIARKAVEKGADSTSVTISSEKPESISFFLKHGFRIVKKVANAFIKGFDEYVLIHSDPEKLLAIDTLELLLQNTSYPVIELTKTPLPAEFPSMIEKTIIKHYLTTRSLDAIRHQAKEDLGIQLSRTFIEETISLFHAVCTKWQTSNLPKKLIAVFTTPVYPHQDDLDPIGTVLTGIDENGRRHILGTIPATYLAPHVWEDLFTKLKQHIETVEIFAHLPLITPPNSPEMKTVALLNEKTWHGRSFLPEAFAKELIDDLIHWKDLLKQERLCETGGVR